MELLDWSCIAAALECSRSSTPTTFVYGECTGPSEWKRVYADARGREQSPVNIVSRCASVLMPSEPLKWHKYCLEPISMNLANDGNTGEYGGIN